MQAYLDFEKPIADLESKIEELRHLSSEGEVNIANEVQRLQEKVQRLLSQTYDKLTPWQKVQVARHQKRPHALAYINAMIDDFTPLAGDRAFADDNAIVGGLGRFRGHSVVVIGNEKGNCTESRIHHNFGMAKPEGYRKAQRLMDDIIDYELNEGTTYANWSSTDVPGIYEEFMSLFGLTHESGNSTYSYGYYANDFATTGLDGDVLMTGVNSTNGTRLYEDYEHASYSYTNTSSIVGVFLTADGGATLSTQQDPTLVSNNANAMANQVPVFTFGAGLLALGLIGFRKKGNGDA